MHTFHILGFKANQVHKKCLVDRNITLSEIYGADYLNSSELPAALATLLATEEKHAIVTIPMGSGSIPIHSDQGLIERNITIPNCNLEEELDNVSA